MNFDQFDAQKFDFLLRQAKSSQGITSQMNTDEIKALSLPVKCDI